MSTATYLVLSTQQSPGASVWGTQLEDGQPLSVTVTKAADAAAAAAAATAPGATATATIALLPGYADTALFDASPVVEIVSGAPTTTDAAEREAWVDGGFKGLAEMLQATAGGSSFWHGVVGGWDRTQCRAYVLLGWDSKEAHLEWKAKLSDEDIAKGMVLFRKGAEDVKMVHLKVEGRAGKD